MRQERSQSEDGGALAFALIATGTILLVGSAAMYVSMSGRRTSVAGLHSQAAFACAEVGLEQGRQLVAANRADWNTVLAKEANSPPDTTGYPVWYQNLRNGTTQCVAGSTAYTYRVRIRDNVDELPPAANNQAVDNDGAVIVDAEAMQAGTPLAKVSAVIMGTGLLTGDYKDQAGLGARKYNNETP